MAAKHFAYGMILAGLLLELFTFQLCRFASCYFIKECNGEISIECLAIIFAASISLIVGGAYILKMQRDKKYV